jgi:hypothetical protein
MKIGATMILGMELFHDSKKEKHVERASEVGKGLEDLKLLLAVECKGAGGSRGGPDVYRRQEMRREATMLLAGGGERCRIAKWGVTRAKEIWSALEDPSVDGGEIQGRVAAADELIDAIAAGKRSRDRYKSHATAMQSSPMDVNRVMNWLASLQKWDAMRQVEQSDVILGATVILCGECTDSASEAEAAERVVAVQRTLTDLRRRFGSFSSGRSYVVTRGTLVVVVLIAPTKELFEIQNCITPFFLMQNPISNAFAQAPSCHLIARELFYAADNSRRLLWAVANMTLLTERALSVSRKHSTIAGLVSSALTAPAAEWQQIIAALSRNRCAILAIFSVPGTSPRERLQAILPLLVPTTTKPEWRAVDMSTLVSKSTIREMRTTTRCRKEGIAHQVWIRLNELVNRPVFDLDDPVTQLIGPAATSLLAGAYTCLTGTVSTLVTGCNEVCKKKSKSKVQSSKHISRLNTAGFLASWTLPKMAQQGRSYTGFKRSRDDGATKEYMAEMRQAARKQKKTRKVKDGSTMVQLDSATGLDGDLPSNRLIDSSARFSPETLVTLMRTMRWAENQQLQPDTKPFELTGEDSETARMSYRFQYPCTIAQTGEVGLLSETFPATRTGAPMEAMPYPMTMISAVYDPIQAPPTCVTVPPPKPPPKPPPRPPPRPHRECEYFSKMWESIDPRPSQ